MRRRAFTLIELLITVTIFTVVIVAICGVFNMGIKTWRRGQDEKSIQEIRLCFLKMEKELRSSFFFSGIPFKGTYKEIVFPLTVSEGDKDKIYTITYAVEKGKKPESWQINRKERLFSDSIAGETEETSKKLSPAVEEIKFEYAYRDAAPPGAFKWKEAWDAGASEKKLPSGVRISLKEGEGAKIYNKVIFLMPEDIQIE